MCIVYIYTIELHGKQCSYGGVYSHQMCSSFAEPCLRSSDNQSERFIFVDYD